MKVVLIFCVALMIFCGCGCSSVDGCIKVGGGKDDWKGEVEWCFSPKMSEELGQPVLEGSNGQALMISKEDAQKLNELLRDEKSAKMSSPDKRHPFEVLVKKIKSN